MHRCPWCETVLTRLAEGRPYVCPGPTCVNVQTRPDAYEVKAGKLLPLRWDAHTGRFLSKP